MTHLGDSRKFSTMQIMFWKTELSKDLNRAKEAAPRFKAGWRKQVRFDLSQIAYWNSRLAWADRQEAKEARQSQ